MWFLNAIHQSFWYFFLSLIYIFIICFFGLQTHVILGNYNHNHRLIIVIIISIIIDITIEYNKSFCVFSFTSISTTLITCESFVSILSYIHEKHKMQDNKTSYSLHEHFQVGPKFDKHTAIIQNSSRRRNKNRNVADDRTDRITEIKSLQKTTFLQQTNKKDEFIYNFPLFFCINSFPILYQNAFVCDTWDRHWLQSEELEI